MLADEAKFYRALGDETRLLIVKSLLENDSCACDFTTMTKKDQTTVSRHLKVLVEAGVLKNEKRGRNVVYSVKDDETRSLLLNMGMKPIKMLHSCCTK